MIYGTHRLYDADGRLTTNAVVETCDYVVTTTYPFECEKHSMLWYDAIYLSHARLKRVFLANDDLLSKYIAAGTVTDTLHAYAVTYEEDGVAITPLQ